VIGDASEESALPAASTSSTSSFSFFWRSVSFSWMEWPNTEEDDENEPAPPPFHSTHHHSMVHGEKKEEGEVKEGGGRGRVDLAPASVGSVPVRGGGGGGRGDAPLSPLPTKEEGKVYIYIVHELF